MKKLKLLLGLSVLFFALYSCNEQLEVQGLESLEAIDSNGAIQKDYTPNDDCGNPVECTLIAGQSIDVGKVTVWNDKNTLYVKVFSREGFQDVNENIKMWVGTDLPSKRPPAGKFPYKYTETGLEHTFIIPLSGLDDWDNYGDCAQHFYIIVHADVLTIAGDTDSGETAFSGCEEGTGKAWWYYMEYTTGCCEENYAFLYHHKDFVTCFNDNGVFGWSNDHHYRYYRNGGTRINPIYLNYDNDCNTDNVINIGEANYNLLNPNTDNEVMNVHFSMLPGSDNYNYKIYIGWKNPIENGVIIDDISFDRIESSAQTFNFKKPVNLWEGIDPRIDDPSLQSNPIFYVIVRVTMIL